MYDTIRVENEVGTIEKVLKSISFISWPSKFFFKAVEIIIWRNYDGIITPGLGVSDYYNKYFLIEKLINIVEVSDFFFFNLSLTIIMIDSG